MNLEARAIATSDARSDHAIRSGRSPNLRLPFAGELQGALADPPRRTEGLVHREGGEPFGLRLALGSQEVKQTHGLTLRS